MVAALASLLTGGALPAAGSDSARPDPATSHPPAPPSTEPAPQEAPGAASNAAPPPSAPSTPAAEADPALPAGYVPSQDGEQGQGPSPSQSQGPSLRPVQGAQPVQNTRPVRNDLPAGQAAPPARSAEEGPQEPRTQAPRGSRSPGAPGTPASPRNAASPRNEASPRTPESSKAPSTSRTPQAPPSPDTPQSPRAPQALPDPAAPDAPADPRAPGAPGVPGGTPSLIQGDPRNFGAQIFQGYAFDTCQAPSAATMRAWKKSSPYGAAGVYIGGRGRACPNQKHLSPSWVKAAHSMGWKFLPLYVGSQSPCVGAAHKRKVRMSTSAPYQQGRREGLDAVRQAQRLGMVRRSAVYLDMEAYDHKNASCAATTLRFIQGWNSAVRAQGYVAGFYSSADSGIAHLEKARASGARGLPTALWFARWRVPKSVDNERRIHRNAWQPHRRAHQFTGNVTRTYGGRAVTIDQNLVDAPVAVIG